MKNIDNRIYNALMYDCNYSIANNTCATYAIRELIATNVRRVRQHKHNARQYITMLKQRIDTIYIDNAR